MFLLPTLSVDFTPVSGHSVEGITTAYITGLIIPFVCVFVFREVIVCVLLNREVIRELSKYVC